MKCLIYKFINYLLGFMIQHHFVNFFGGHVCRYWQASFFFPQETHLQALVDMQNLPCCHICWSGQTWKQNRKKFPHFPLYGLGNITATITGNWVSCRLWIQNSGWYLMTFAVLEQLNLPLDFLGVHSKNFLLWKNVGQKNSGTILSLGEVAEMVISY